MTTITTLVTLARGDVITIDDELMRVVRVLGHGEYELASLTRWERWRVWVRGRRYRLRRRITGG